MGPTTNFLLFLEIHGNLHRVAIDLPTTLTIEYYMEHREQFLKFLPDTWDGAKVLHVEPLDDVLYIKSTGKVLWRSERP